MSYIVNGEEVSTKKEATEAVFAAVKEGEEVTVAPAPEEDNEQVADSAEPVAGSEDQPHAGRVGGPAEGPPVIL